MMMMTITSNHPQKSEIEFLLCCTQPELTTTQKDHLLHLGKQELDWSYLISFASEHGLMPLLYRQLKVTCPDIVPEKILIQLRQYSLAKTARNMAMTAELIRILNLCKDQQIPMLSFKGPLLAQLAYGDLSFREFGDLDLLITESELPKVHKLLLAQGYQPLYNIKDSQIEVYGKLQHELAYSHEAKGIIIDLHWSIVHKYFSFSPSSKFIWSKLDQINLNNHKVETLSLEILIVFLCAHSAKHGWSDLSLICELAHLLKRHPQIDWEIIESYMGNLGGRTMVLLSLSLTQTIYGTNLPKNICQQIIKSEPILTKLSAQVEEQIFSPRNKLLDIFSPNFLYSQSMESWQDRFLYWLNVSTTPTSIEMEAISLPTILFPLYYPIRIFRLSYKHLKKFFIKN